MPDLSDTVAKCRMGTAKNFTLLLLLYHTQVKARALSSLWLIKCNKSEERKSTIQTEPAVRSRNIVETQDFCYNGYRTFDDGKRGGSLCTSAINRYGTL